MGYERRFNIGFSFDAAAGFVDAILEGQPEPPLYFARMKNLNKNGVPVLGDVPAPESYTVAQLTERGNVEGAVIVDTRMDREAYMAGHIPGSLHAPLVLCSQSLFRFADLGDDGLCRGGPDKGCGVIVSAIDVVVDRLD